MTRVDDEPRVDRKNYTFALHYVLNPERLRKLGLMLPEGVYHD